MTRKDLLEIERLCRAAVDSATIASAFSGRHQARGEAKYTRLAREALATAIEIIDGIEAPGEPPSFFATACDIAATAQPIGEAA